MNKTTKGYFCDLSLDAVDAVASASHRLLHNGTTGHAYGAQKREAHDEAEFDVLVVSLESLKEPFSEKDSIDHLIFLSETAYEKLWLGRTDQAEPLSRLCVQRELNRKPANVPPHLSLLEEQVREYIVSPYDDRDMKTYNGYYRALLVRSFTQEDSSFFDLLRDHGMCVSYQASASCVYDGEMQVLGFQDQHSDHSLSALRASSAA
jgi:hypothetical protein